LDSGIWHDSLAPERDCAFLWRQPPLTLRKAPPSPPPPLTTRSDIQGKMGSAAYQKPAININQNVGNVTDSYNNVLNNCEISMPDEKRQILEWLSPMAPRERHQAVRDSRMDGVGTWLLGTNEFEKWHTSEDQAVNPVLFCHGDPGVGKTYLRCVKVALLEYWRYAKLTQARKQKLSRNRYALRCFRWRQCGCGLHLLRLS